MPDDVDIPTHQDLKLPTLVAVDRLGGSATIAELAERVPDEAGLTDEQMQVVFPPGSSREGTSKVLYRLGWARSDLKVIGALDNKTRGVWSLTATGRRFVGMDPDRADDEIRNEMKRLYPEYLRKKRLEVKGDARSGWNDKTTPTVDTDDHGPDDHGPDDHGPDDHGPDDHGPDDDWRSVLIDKMKVLDPAAFERLAGRLLRAAGFQSLEMWAQPGDGGIDGFGIYKVSLISFPTYFQCKRYAGTVSAGTVRDFRGAMAGRGEKGLIITTGEFSRDARKEATRDGAPPINLIDGDELCDQLKKYELGVTTKTRVEEDVIVDDDFFSDL